MERYAVVPFPSEQANGNHVNATIAFPSEHKLGTQSYRSRVSSLFVRSRNRNEDGTERLCSHVNYALVLLATSSDPKIH